jgi:hypothetical protein
MSSQVLARKDGAWRVVSLYPDVCKTPMGSAMVPVPYPVTAMLVQSTGTAPHVNANGQPVVIFDQSQVPTTVGDAAGSATGVKSGTVGGACWPKSHSPSVRVHGKQVIRHGDQFWMNG